MLLFCVLRSVEPPEAINPWFYAYQSEFLRLLRFTEHETLDHPAAGACGCTYRTVCSSLLVGISTGR